MPKPNRGGQRTPTQLNPPPNIPPLNTFNPGQVAAQPPQQPLTPNQERRIDDQNEWANITDTEARILRRSMGQTGDEAGRVRQYMGDNGTTYVTTSKSYLVNNALNSDMQSLTNGYMGDTGNAWHWINHYGYNMNTAKNAVRSIDNGMKPLSKDINVVRYENEFSPKTIANGKYTLAQLRKMTNAELQQALVGEYRDTKSYLSTSWRMDKTAQRDRQYMASPVRIEYTVRKGTQAVVTNNMTEHEILVGRGYRQQIFGARKDGNQIVIQMEITPTKRPAYYKV